MRISYLSSWRSERERAQTNSIPLLQGSKRTFQWAFKLEWLSCSLSCIFQLDLSVFFFLVEGSWCPGVTRRAEVYLDQITSEQLRLPSRNAVVQDLPALAQAELHDVMLDRCCVIGRRDPGEQDSLLCPIGCEAPWWGKQHQWFRGTCRKYWEEHTGIEDVWERVLVF